MLMGAIIASGAKANVQQSWQVPQAAEAGVRQSASKCRRLRGSGAGLIKRDAVGPARDTTALGARLHAVWVCDNGRDCRLRRSGAGLMRRDTVGPARDRRCTIMLAMCVYAACM